MSRSPYYTDAVTLVAAAARAEGGIEVFVNISEYERSFMTFEKMTAREEERRSWLGGLVTDWSPQQRAHWIAEQVLDWSGIPTVTVRAAIFVENPLLTWASAGSGGVRHGSTRCSGSSGTTGCSIRSGLESAPSAIGRITIDAKPEGERRTGNLSAPFERAGAGNGRFVYRTSPRPYLATIVMTAPMAPDFQPSESESGATLVPYTDELHARGGVVRTRKPRDFLRHGG